MCPGRTQASEGCQEGEAGVFLPSFPRNEKWYPVEWASLSTGCFLNSVWDVFRVGTWVPPFVGCGEEVVGGDYDGGTGWGYTHTLTAGRELADHLFQGSEMQGPSEKSRQVSVDSRPWWGPQGSGESCSAGRHSN